MNAASQAELIKQLEFSHNTYAVYVRLRLLHRLGHGSAEKVEEARALAKRTKTDLLAMLGCSG